MIFFDIILPLAVSVLPTVQTSAHAVHGAVSAQPVETEPVETEATTQPVEATAQSVEATAQSVEATAQPVEATAQPVEVVEVVEAKNIRNLPANTEVFLKLNHEITTKKNKQGDPIYFTVTHNVLLDNYVVIPKGSGAIGEITWMTGKGMFGKSGKFDLEVKYLTVGDRRVPLLGTFRQEGRGNTVATVAGVVVIPIAGLFVTGRSGFMPKDREITAFTAEDLPVIIPKEKRQTQAAGIVAKEIIVKEIDPAIMETSSQLPEEEMPETKPDEEEPSSFE